VSADIWPVKMEDMQRFERTERMMVRWMCGIPYKSQEHGMKCRFKWTFGFRGGGRYCDTWSTEMVWTSQTKRQR